MWDWLSILQQEGPPDLESMDSGYWRNIQPMGHDVVLRFFGLQLLHSYYMTRVEWHKVFLQILLEKGLVFRGSRA